MMPAWDESAEQAVLGACFAGYDSSAFGRAAVTVQRADFYLPAHQLIWGALESMATSGVPIDPAGLERILRKAGALTKAGGAVYLHTLMERACVPEAVTYHAEAIADAAIVRRVAQVGQRIAQAAEAPDVDPAELVKFAGDQLAAARDDRAGVEILAVDYETFLHRTADAPDPVIPGLLGKGDRLVLTGTGGLGKSTFLQQVIVCAAAGVHPLAYQRVDPYDPVPVMIHDSENPDHRRKTRLFPMVRGLVNLGCDPRPNLHLAGNGSSFDLLNAANALALLRTVEKIKPQLLYIGPVYKLHNDDPDKEITVKKITHVLDGVREMGCAIITEAHPNKASKSGGPMSPSGASLWEWWPEFGLGLRLDPDSDDITRRCKLERWRIDRDVSEWPLFVQASGDPALPWIEAAVTPGYLVGEGDKGYDPSF